jgi:purine nucleosidase/pyrimidine-specific ribonucleoside hydrolase
VQSVIIDTDGGVDDALALLYALACPNVDIEAITTVHGNVPVDAATRNVGEVLRVAGRQVTVARGAAAPLAVAAVTATDAHGDDGLGGWTRLETSPVPNLDELPAHQLILSRAGQAPGTITLITLGPLTNAALALAQDASGFRLLKQVVVMGGAVWGPGNMTAVAEFNVFADPHAASDVVRSGVPVILVGLDVTRKAVLSREALDAWLGSRSDLRARFLHCITDQMFAFYRSRIGADEFYLHDPLAVGIALDPSLARMLPMHINIETAGELTRGMVVAERRPWAQKPANADVCADIDADRFLERFADLVARVPPSG